MCVGDVAALTRSVCVCVCGGGGGELMVSLSLNSWDSSVSANNIV